MKTTKTILIIFCILISTIAIGQSGESEVKNYYENGTLKEIGQNENGDATGIWKSYHENGTLATVGKYIEGYEAGDWNYYDKNGKLEETIKYFDGKQSDNLPPIQKYLGKIKSEETQMEVSQKLTSNTFIVNYNYDGAKWKETFTGIDWSEFSKYRTKEYKDFFVVEFHFHNKIALQKDDVALPTTNEEVYVFNCKFLHQDQEVIEGILEEWDELRGY